MSDEEISLNSGYQLLANGNAVDAINKHFKSLTEQCDVQYENSEKQVYAARSKVESLFYMLKAMSEEKYAIVISSTCAESNYYMGYASLDLGRIKKAEQYIKRALDFSPVNSMYLSELAHIYQINKDWDQALSTFYQAEGNASVYSPEQLKLLELTRAKRGIGFVLIELGQLQKAKLKFEECLELDPNDKNALNEINYIKGLIENS
ncbi:MAG: tetratricopeptide repeat protein [Colwellia sp.]|nr:tetratricopeptide repeat protein [Colwellia sp.]